MSKKLLLILTTLFLTSSCANLSEKANDAYDSVAGAVSKGYSKVKDTVTGDD